MYFCRKTAGGISPKRVFAENQPAEFSRSVFLPENSFRDFRKVHFLEGRKALGIVAASRRLVAERNEVKRSNGSGSWNRAKPDGACRRNAMVFIRKKQTCCCFITASIFSYALLVFIYGFKKICYI